MARTCLWVARAEVALRAMLVVDWRAALWADVGAGVAGRSSRSLSAAPGTRTTGCERTGPRGVAAAPGGGASAAGTRGRRRPVADRLHLRRRLSGLPVLRAGRG